MLSGYCGPTPASLQIYLITLNPSVEAVKEREKKRNKKDYISWNVEGLYSVLINENPRIGPWIDSMNMTSEEMLAEIIKRVELEV